MENSNDSNTPLEENQQNSQDQIFPIDRLPNELKLAVFMKLDLNDLASMMRVSREWHDIIHSQSTWKQLCERDLRDFLYSKPLEELEMTPGFKPVASEIWKSDACGNIFQAPESTTEKGTPVTTTNNEEWEEWKVQSYSPEGSSSEDEEQDIGHNTQEDPAVRFFIKKRKAKYELGREKKISREEHRPKTRNWLDFYQFCKTSPNLTGIWTACYGTHGDEFVQVDHNGYNLHATKITGDVHIPAGKPTFNICLSSNLQNGKGEIHLAEANYESPRWGEASFQLKDKDSFDVMWPFQTTFHSFICTLHFRRKPDHAVIPPELLLQHPISNNSS